MTKLVWPCVVCLVAVMFLGVLARADGPDGDSAPDSAARARYDKAVAHANEVYSKLLAAADRQFLADLKSAQAKAKHGGNADDAPKLQAEIAELESASTDHLYLATETGPLSRTPDAQTIDPSDPMGSQIKHHKIVKGMTQEQMEESMQFSGDSTAITKGGVDWTASPTITTKDNIQQYKWSIGFTAGSKGYTETRVVNATLKDGVVTDVSETRVAKLDNEPE